MWLAKGLVFLGIFANYSTSGFEDSVAYSSSCRDFLAYTKSYVF